MKRRIEIRATFDGGLSLGKSFMFAFLPNAVFFNHECGYELQIYWLTVFVSLGMPKRKWEWKQSGPAND